MSENPEPYYFYAPAGRSNPLYVITPRAVGMPESELSSLLSPKLVTTTFSMSPKPWGVIGDLTKIRIKTDDSGGVVLPRLNVVGSRYNHTDAFITLSNEGKLSAEIVEAREGHLRAKVTHDPNDRMIRLEFEVTPERLIATTRYALCTRVDSDLRYAPADSFLVTPDNPMKLIKDDFDVLASKLRGHYEALIIGA